ncbi:MAG: T9SS type A sorting domain-containing protein [Bacteroidetes bacterium]|nr:T9SS type A sorting domain-containing protein [Bacteroidota bacterium]
MKRILLFAIFALSIGAIAQNKRPDIQTPPPSRYSQHDVQGIQEDDGLITTGFCSEPNSSLFADNLTFNERELMQIIDSMYRWRWDTLGNGWQLGNKYIDLVYNAKNYLTSYIGQTWNGSAWRNVSKALITYDAYNNQTSNIDLSWDGATWVNSNQYLYTYDAGNNLTNEILQHWITGEWVNINQYTNTYDGSNKLINQIYQRWLGGAWENRTLYLHTYDAANNLTSSLTQNWINDTWVDTYQTLSTYNANNNRTNSLLQKWNGADWVNFQNITYTHDANNNMTGYIMLKWNGSAWENNNQYFHTYDASNNLIKELSQYWTGNTWVNYYKYNYAYDANNFPQSQSHIYYDDAGNITFGDSTYYFFHTVMGTDDLPEQEESISVYPNPTPGKFTINCSKTISSIEVFNTPGDRIYADQKFTRQKSNDIDLSGYEKGIYLIKISAGTANYKRKIVIR